MGKFRVLVGDCKKTLKKVPDGSIAMCVTSPPYFGLRDYGTEDQIGLEQSPEDYVASLVEVFREIRRTLREDGTLWLNISDSYSGSGKGANSNGTFTGKAKQDTNKGTRESDGKIKRMKLDKKYKHKDLIGIPWMLAIALREDGWYLRQDIIWHKLNPMPEPVGDRCTRSHEYVFLLSKSKNYYFDSDAIKTIAKTENSHLGKSNRVNKRSVWPLASQPYRGGHHAVFPPDLILPCVQAGSKEGDTIIDPFGGSGTSAGVALALNRSAILCELNPAYVSIMPDRVKGILERYRNAKPVPLILFNGTKKLRKVKRGSADLIIVEKTDISIGELSRIKSPSGSIFYIDRRLSVEELTEIISSNTAEGQTVFCPNIFKGRIGIVCAKLNRHLIGIGHDHYDKAKNLIARSYRKHYSLGKS